MSLIHCGFYHSKGGVGKTTLAINVSAALSRQGLSVLLVDLDPQRSSKWISGIADAFPFAVEAGWPDSPPNVDVLVTDHPPRLENMPPGGIIAVPVRPVAHEVAALVKTIKLLQDTGQHTIYPVLNFYDSRRADHRENIAAMPELEAAPHIGNRAVFERAINRGLTIFDRQLDRMSGVSQARAEIELLAEYLYNKK